MNFRWNPSLFYFWFEHKMAELDYKRLSFFPAGCFSAYFVLSPIIKFFYALHQSVLGR